MDASWCDSCKKKVVLRNGRCIFCGENPIEEKVAEPEPVKNKFRGVQVIPCSNACKSAISISKMVFLEAELSRLPLVSCDQAYHCKCKFKYFDDRRQNEDRRSSSKVLQDVFNGDEHRVKKKKGRRKDD